MAYRFVKISGFYKNYLTYYYQKYPFVKGLSYSDQYRHLMDQGYGYSDFFHKHFVKHDVEGWEIVYNASPLQRAWAKEHNSVKIGESLILEQLKSYKPDVVFFQDSISFSPGLFSAIKKEIPSVRLLIGMCCSPITSEILDNYHLFDFMVGCSPHFTQMFDKAGIKNYEFTHCFEPSILKKLPDSPERKTDLLFIGSFIDGKNFHTDRNRIISNLMNDKRILLQVYGNLTIEPTYITTIKQIIYPMVRFMNKIGLNNFVMKIPFVKKVAMMDERPRRSNYSKAFVSKVNQSPVFGYDMYRLLQESKIGFNMHAGVSGEYAANVRMFEVTGVGSLLLTDHKKDISKLFDPNNEIVTYQTVDECLEKVNWLLSHPDKLKEIAEAGQRRTLRDHTVEKRVEYLNDIIKSNF